MAPLTITPPSAPGLAPRMDIYLKDHQWDFVTCNTRFTCLDGGARNGKSWAAIFKVRGYVMSKENSHWIVGRWDSTKLDSSTIKDWFRLFPEDRRYFNKSTKTLILPGNRRVDFVHLSEYAINTTLDGFWMEQGEECTIDTFNYLRLRLSQDDAHGVVTSNPLADDWIDWIFVKNEEAKDLEGAPHPDTGKKYNPKFAYFHAPTDANASNLPKEYMEDLDDLPEEIAARMRRGERGAFSGKVYKQFRHNIHVIDPCPIPDTWKCIEGIDWGKSGGWFVWLQVRVSPGGDLIVSQEYYAKELLVSEHVEEIKRRAEGVRCGKRVLDTACWIQNQENTNWKRNGRPKFYSLADEFRWSGLPCDQAQKSIEWGIEQVQKYMKIDPEHVHPFQQEKGAPRLYIFRSCPNLVRQIRAYKRPEQTRQSAMNHDATELPIHKDCDGPDALRYIIATRPSPSQIKRPIPRDSVAEVLEQIEADEAMASRRRN